MGKTVGKSAAHEHQPFKQSRQFGIVSKQKAHIGHRADRQQCDFAGMAANGILHEGEPFPLRKIRAVRPAAQPLELGDRRRRRVVEYGAARAGIQGDILSCGIAEGACQPAAVVGFPKHRRDAHQLAFRLHQQIRQAYGVVDIAADIGIQQNFFHTV